MCRPRHSTRNHHCVIAHLLHTQTLQSDEATGSELVAIVSESKLPIAIVAPAIHLQSHEESMSTVMAADDMTCCLSLTSPLSTTARDEVCPQTMLTATLFCRQLDTLRGVGWFAVEPEPT